MRNLKSTDTVLSVFNLSPRRIGGIETIIRELSLQLSQRGWRHALCFRASPPEPVRKYLELPNVSIDTIDHISRWSRTFHRQLIELIDRHGPSAVHFNFMDLFGPFAVITKLRGVSRVFFTDHISRPETFLPRRASVLKKIAYRLAVPVTKVFCVSDFVRQCWLTSEALPSDRFITVYNGIDLDRCERSQGMRKSFRARHSLPEHAVVVTQIGSLMHEKGCGTLLEAARIVVDAAPQALFVLAGDGKQRDQYCSAAAHLGLARQVRFIGLIDDPVGEGLFAGSDIICQASNWHEAFGLSIAESMASRRPVVATRIGGIPELVQHEKTGILVERGDSAALAEGILKLVRDPDLGQRYGDAGRQFCRENFDHRANVSQMIDLYDLPSIHGNTLKPSALSG